MVRLEPVVAVSLAPFGPATFYFGSAMPAGANAQAVLDTGIGFGVDRDQGYDYGWDCDGDTNVDWSGGRREAGRDGGLGVSTQAIPTTTDHIQRDL